MDIEEAAFSMFQENNAGGLGIYKERAKPEWKSFGFRPLGVSKKFIFDVFSIEIGNRLAFFAPRVRWYSRLHNAGAAGLKYPAK